jgi:hypothetical protein
MTLPTRYGGVTGSVVQKCVGSCRQPEGGIAAVT